MTRIVLFLVLIAGLAACGEPPTEPEFFPLNDGWRWTYTVTEDRPEGTTVRQFTEENLAPEEVDGNRVVPRRTSDGTVYYIRHDESGLARIAKRSRVQPQPVRDPEPRMVLAAPFTKGTGWGYATPIFLMQRQRPESTDRQRLLHEGPVVMNFVIEQTGVTVAVPAGRFEECLKVVGQAQKTLFADPDQGFVDVPITQNEWYCKGVGLVRLERLERLNSQFYKGGTMTFDLTRLEK
ncbi:MAG: hypothetical protein ACPGO3_03790 [Magnetospiraceae bacterium]